MSSVARFSLVALDCPDPRALAEFYAALTGWPIDEDSSEEWVELVSAGGPTLAFQRAPDHQAPSAQPERNVARPSAPERP